MTEDQGFRTLFLVPAGLQGPLEALGGLRRTHNQTYDGFSTRGTQQLFVPDISRDAPVGSPRHLCFHTP